MDAITTYTYSTSAWFGIQAVPLLFFPQLITALLSPEARRSSGTSFINFLSKKKTPKKNRLGLLGEHLGVPQFFLLNKQ